MGIANCKSVNPELAKESFLDMIYPKRQIFPKINDSQKKNFPTLRIFLFFIMIFLILN